MRKVAISAIASLLLAAAGQGGTIFTNLGPGDGFAPVGVAIGVVPFTSAFNYAGISFTATGQSYLLDSIELPLQLITSSGSPAPGGSNVVDVFLTSDNHGLPGSVIESFEATGALAPGSPVLVTFDSTTHPALAAGQTYWVVAAGGADISVSWLQNDLQEMGPNVSGPSLSNLVRDSDQNVREAMLVSGTAVPEPGTASSVGALLVLTAVVFRAGVFRKERRYRQRG